MEAALFVLRLVPFALSMFYCLTKGYWYLGAALTILIVSGFLNLLLNISPEIRGVFGNTIAFLLLVHTLKLAKKEN